jgi:hypothetical protein
VAELLPAPTVLPRGKSGGRVGSGSDGTHLCPRRPPRRNAHPRLTAASRQAGYAALHRPPLRPFQRPPAGGVGRWQEENANRLSIALVSRGDPEGAIASPMAGGVESIRPFVARAVAAPANVPLLPCAPAPRAAQEGQPWPNCGKVRGCRVGSFDTTSDTTQSATCRNVGLPLAMISA